jgi:hypothetical protein
MKATPFLFLIFLFLQFQTAQAISSQAYQIQKQISDELQGDDSFQYSDYYKIKEDAHAQNLDLLNLDHVQAKFPYPSVPYNRKDQFGAWIKDRTDGTCMDTRGKVLVRDSSSTVTYRPNGCTVDSGDWDDPYSGKHFVWASDIQIDHFVPLKNAYMTGGFEWDQKKRCLYANYMGNEFHLLSVSGRENLRKSDSTPNQYMPPNRSYACVYLKQWLQIKLVWSLRITPKEAAAIHERVEENNCDKTDFVISEKFLEDQRRYMANNANLCRK